MTISKQEKVLYLLASLCALLGAVMLFVFTAVRFTGFLFCCAAAALVLYALLTRWSKAHAWARLCRQIFLLLLALGFLLFAVLEAWVISCGRTDWETPVEAVVVLGAGVNGTEPSLSLRVRLEAALEYIQDKPDIPIVVTGAQGPGEIISEARCMADWLIAHGVAEERILLEEQATNTEENLWRSLLVLEDHGISMSSDGEYTGIAMVSSDYHLCRVKWLGGGVPVAAHMPARYFPLTVNYYVREAFAMAELLFLRG